MPESRHYPEPEPAGEVQDEREQEFASRMTEARAKMERVWDDAHERRVTPTELLLEDPESFERARSLFGDEEVAAFIAGVENVPSDDKDMFVRAMLPLLEPFIRARIFDADVRARVEADERTRRGDHIDTGVLTSHLHTSEWTFRLADGADITTSDRVLEVGLKEKPKGIHSVRDSLRQIAGVLEEQPNIKAVLGVLWILSRGIAERLGFERVADASVPDEQRQHILTMAVEARADKPYQQGVTKDDVVVAAMSREQFLARYGENKT